MTMGQTLRNILSVIALRSITLIKSKIGWKPGLVESWLEGQGFESHTMLDGNGIKAMPGLVPSSFNN